MIDAFLWWSGVVGWVLVAACVVDEFVQRRRDSAERDEWWAS